jgi:molecular chaperone DnaJ
MTKDYYNILGVSKDASKEDIKKSYKKLAKKYHPDLNKNGDAETKFKEINEAVSVLADDQKRAQYDQFGSTDFGGAQQGFDFTDFMRGFDFGQFGGGFDDIFEKFFGGRGRRQRGADLAQEVVITLEEVAEGVMKTLNVNKLDVCSDCNGSGGDRDSCEICKGHGVQTKTQRTPFGMFQTQMRCRDCGGEGSQVVKECKKCHGEGRVRVRKALSIKIPPGVEEGMRLRVRGEGVAPEHGGEPGDLYVIIRVEEHPIFIRRDNDILLEVPISFSQAVLGDKIEVPTLNGKATLKIPAYTQNDTLFKMSGKGIGGVGDQLVKVTVNVPEKMSKKELKVVKDLSGLEKEKPAGFLKKFFR